MKSFKAFFLFLFSFSILALEIPSYSSPVVDHAGLLSGTTKQALNGALENFKQNHGPQIAVLTIPSLEGEILEQFSIKVVDEWKVGQKSQDNGVLLLVALQERKMRIEVGRGLEGQLTDAYSGRIIDLMKVYFKSKNYEQGILIGLQAIAGSLGGKLVFGDQALQQSAQVKDEANSSLLVFVIFLFIFIMNILGSFSRRSPGTSLHRGASPWFIPGGGGRFGGGGFGGGGFGGGGGGGFSGGGASGGW